MCIKYTINNTEAKELETQFCVTTQTAANGLTFHFTVEMD